VILKHSNLAKVIVQNKNNTQRVIYKESEEIMRKSILILLVFFISGCASIHSSGVETLLRQSHPAICESHGIITNNTGDEKKFSAHLKTFLKTRKDKNAQLGETIDMILDCIVGQIKYTGSNSNNELNQVKLYRGYVTLAVISRYAAFNYTGVIGNNINVDFRAYSDLPDDAASVLSRIESANRLLRYPLDMSLHPSGAAEGMFENAAYEDKLPTVYKLHRVLSVMLVATAAERPTFHRAKGFLSDFFKMIATKSIGNADDVIKSGANILAKSLTLKAFGNAYLNDVRTHIESFTNNTPSNDDWEDWISIVDDSCNIISNVSNTKHHCTND
jgi:hypothetical protein